MTGTYITVILYIYIYFIFLMESCRESFFGVVLVTDTSRTILQTNRSMCRSDMLLRWHHSAPPPSLRLLPHIDVDVHNCNARRNPPGLKISYLPMPLCKACCHIGEGEDWDFRFLKDINYREDPHCLWQVLTAAAHAMQPQTIHTSTRSAGVALAHPATFYYDVMCFVCGGVH